MQTHFRRKALTRQNISSNSPYESVFGYSRAVKIGKQIFVSGTTAMQPDGKVTGGGDAYAQTVAALKTIAAALAEGGAAMKDVVRTRVYVTNFDDFDAVAKAHCAVFGTIRPASTGVEVSRLVSPDMLVEIEADAIIE
jgi:enamine deaminase RidA (YjgF/YER057c/UK114 family)